MQSITALQNKVRRNPVNSHKPICDTGICNAPITMLCCRLMDGSKSTQPYKKPNRHDLKSSGNDLYPHFVPSMYSMDILP